ncbi:MAG: SRPBCC domain-containing protein [Candidatus Sericytochromatia bacterium]
MPELVSTRLLPVSRERAFAALSDLDQLVRWWGPDGFTSTSEAFDFSPGGAWTMVLHGPDGTDYPNLYNFTAIEPPARAVVEHPHEVHWFELTIAFDEAPGGTQVIWRQRFDDEAHFAEIKDVVAAANDQVLARLEAVVAG